MRAMEESNPRHRFWRPKLYHLTNRPITTKSAYADYCTKQKDKKELFLSLFVLGISLTPFAKFLKLDFFSDEFFVFT